MKIINSFLSIKIKNNQNNEHTLVMQDIDGNIKFFNRYKNDLLTVYTNIDSFESTLKAYEDITDVYDLALYGFDKDKLISHEILVISNNEECNYFDLSNRILNNVKKRILTTSDSISVKNLKYKLEEYKVNEFDKFLSIITELNIELPMVYSHGDLQRSNILFDKSNTYLIDLDDYNKFSLLFDFFTLITSEHYIYQNNALLESYIEGKYDIQLESIFKVSNFNFYKNNKIEYLIFFMIERFVNFEVPRLYKNLRKDFDQDEFDNTMTEYLFRMNSLSRQ